MDNGEASYRLFHKRYDVRVPAYQLVSKAEMDLVGVPHSGDKRLDKALREDFRPARLTPIGLTLLFEEGASILFTHPKDAMEVFNDIITHLENWDHLIKTSYNIVAPPIDELDQLVNFSRGLEAYSYYMDKQRGTNFAFSKQMLRFEESNIGFAQMPTRKRIALSESTQKDERPVREFASFDELREYERNNRGMLG